MTELGVLASAVLLALLIVAEVRRAGGRSTQALVMPILILAIVAVGLTAGRLLLILISP